MLNTSCSNTVTLTFLAMVLCLFSKTGLAEKCLYVSSYHNGYAWSDGIEKGLRSELKGKCELKIINMNTKRNKEESYKKAIALEVRNLILSWQPDVVIASDDNAAKYVIKPYFRDHRIPFVFCGINWNVDAYGFPYSNTTGMVEVAPITALFDRVTDISGKPKTAFYIGADTTTERKNLARFKQEAMDANIVMSEGLAQNTEQWLNFYTEAQKYDFVVVGSNSGINDWDGQLIQNQVKVLTRKPSVTNHSWMMPYTLLGLTKIPEEQGKWSAQAAISILQGTPPSDIPIVSNRKWDIWINEGILKKTSLSLPRSIIRKAKKSQ